MEVETIITEEERQEAQGDTRNEAPVANMTYDDLKKAMEPQEDLEQQPVEEAEENKEPSKEEPKEETPQVETVPKSEFEKLEKRVRDQELFIARQGTELGKTRKEREELRKAIELREKEIADSFFDNPANATRETITLERDKERLKEMDRLAVVQEIVSKSRDVVTEHAPDFEQNLPDIAKILVEEDREDPAWVAEFQRNPYVVRGIPIDPAVFYHLNKRLSVQKENLTLKDEITKLKAENETLRKKPGKILSQIEQASKHTMSSGTPGAAKTGPISKPVHSMTLEELKQMAARPTG